MVVLSVIMGALMVICGTLCLATPIGTAFDLMYFYMILLLVFGIMTLVRNISQKKFGVDFIFSIITIILGCFIIFTPKLAFVTEIVLLYMMAAWLIVRGIISIVIAIKAKPITGGGVFALALIMAVLTIIVGIYSFIHPILFSYALGVMAGVYFIISGFDMIFDAIIEKKEEKF